MTDIIAVGLMVLTLGFFYLSSQAKKEWYFQILFLVLGMGTAILTTQVMIEVSTDADIDSLLESLQSILYWSTIFILLVVFARVLELYGKIITKLLRKMGLRKSREDVM